MVVVYIYFTRIVVYLLSASIPFYLLWLGNLFTELATLAFFVLTGYKFRPSSENAYALLRGDDEDNYRGPREGQDGMAAEYGLVDNDIDLEVARLICSDIPLIIVN